MSDIRTYLILIQFVEIERKCNSHNVIHFCHLSIIVCITVIIIVIIVVIIVIVAHLTYRNALLK